MAKVTFINAILSGKLEGVIYSRNKGGFYVKGWTIPLNPRSPAQSAARSAFGTTAGNWHSMSDAQKISWNNFGQNFYKSKDEDTPSPIAGINAYVGCYFSAVLYQSLKRATTITQPAGAVATFGNFIPSLVAPTGRPAGVIQTSASAPLPLSLTSATLVAASGAVTAEFTFPAAQPSAPVFVDPVTAEPVGLVLQISVPTLQLSHHIGAPHRQTVAVIGPPAITSGWTSSNKITFSCAAADLNPTKFKAWPASGQIVELAAYLCTAGGQTAQLGTRKLVVS